MFKEFENLALPVFLTGALFVATFPGFWKLLPMVAVGGVLWALFYVAKGFAMADNK